MAIALACAAPSARADAERRTAEPIDRFALVTRHNPVLRKIDPSAPMMVGNGNFAFTADITGLQTFQEQYSRLVPLMTQAQWAWHSFPNPNNYKYEDVLVPVEVRGRTRKYAWLRDSSELDRPDVAWFRENPHRFSLGRLSLYMTTANGQTARFSDLSATEQSLDMWRGVLSSRFVFEGEEVRVQTRVHPELDMVIVDIVSPLLATGRLGVELKFPGVSRQLNPDPADWSHPELHATKITAEGKGKLALERRLDDTKYYVVAQSDENVSFTPVGAHVFRIMPPAQASTFSLMVLFSPTERGMALPSAQAARDAVTAWWERYWSRGGMVDFSGSTDPRASELERRVVLSQYLMAVNAAGSLPPQEEGLFSNSWNGKFHVEMHLWHAAHFALWGRSELLERSMSWYLEHLPEAKRRASAQGLRGAWWPKQVGPEGRESPSAISPFIMWQQPHPIFLAELIYRDQSTRASLNRYRRVVFETADLLASFLQLDEQRDEYMLGPPVIPAQEVFPPLTTYNPTFELQYFRIGLVTAQIWRERLGMSRDREWDRVLEKLAAPPIKDGLYLATESFPQLWEQARSPACSRGKTAPSCWNRDHPSFLGAFGLLPGSGIDRAAMRRTLDAVRDHWDLRQTWGWDFPLMAMAAARLNEPEMAVDFLFYDSRNNQYGVTGMTPRVHLDEHASSVLVATKVSGGADKAPARANPDGPGYVRAAETYFPSNGALLLAVGMMAEGWSGESGDAPGFPKNGKWVVRAEGLRDLP